MQITLNFPDSCYADDPVGYAAFFERLQQMLNRMAVSHSKYQHRAVPPTMEAATEPIDEVKSLIQRLCMYDDRPGLRQEACACDRGLEIPGTSDMCGTPEYDHEESCFLKQKPVGTGNVENLLDVANMAVIESLYPKHQKAHFKPQESKDSPGLSYLP